MITPLSNTRKGEHITIQCLSCSCTENCRLQDLGCREGAQATVVSNQKDIILQIGGSRIAISALLAQSILVAVL